MERDEDEFRKQYRKDLRTPEWRAYSLEMCAKRGRCCQRCGRRGGLLVVHHKYYLRGLRAWDYGDEAVEVVHAGRCHRGADRDREDQDRLDRIRKEFGPEALKHVTPHQDELRKLAQVETRFKQWLIDSGRVPPDWDWDNRTYPLWYFWNEFSDDFRRDVNAPYNQGQLGLGL